MLAIRSWLLVVTLVAVLCGALVLIAPALDQQALAQQTSRRVENAAQAAELLLRLHMQKWLDAATQLASDSVIGDALDEANRESHELQLLTKSLQGRLRAVRDRSHADVALVLDAKGRLVAESGLDGLKPRTAMTEHEAVASALRGNRGDAFWLLGGRAYRVAIAPASRERGVVVLGQELGPELLATIRDSLGTDLVLVTPERVLAAVPAHPQVAELPARLKQPPSSAVAKESNAWPADRIGRGTQSMLYAGRWLGDPRPGTMLLCAIAPHASFDSPVGRVEATLAQLARSLKADAGLLRILIVVLIVALLLLVFGQWLISFDGSRPLRRLVGEAQLVARGDQQRLSAERLPKRFAVLARTLNAAFDRFGQRARGPAPASRPSERQEAVSPPPAAPAPAPPRPAAPAPTLSNFATSSDTGTAEGVWAVGPQLGDLFTPATAAPAPPPPAAPPARPSAPAMPVAPAAPEDPVLQQVYRDFLETRETCGESIEGLSWEKFHARIKATAAVVQKQHACAEVKYGVYVKDGKAAIKVTPVK